MSGQTTDDMIFELKTNSIYITSKEDAERVVREYITEGSFSLTPNEFSRAFAEAEHKKETGKWLKPGRKSAAVYQVLDYINKSYTKGSMKIGAAFDGISTIQEVETEHFYIPSSYHCLFKCISKHYPDEDFKIMDLKKYNPYEISTIQYYNYFRENNYEENKVLSLVTVTKNDKNKFSLKVKSKKAINKIGACILLVPINKTGNHHAVLVKTDDLKKINIMDIFNSFKLTRDTVLHIENQKLAPLKIRTPQNKFYIYDIETSSLEFTEKDIIKRRQIPEGLSYCLVDMTIHATDHSKLDTKAIIGQDCYEQFLKILASANKGAKEPIIIMAHNGGNFDNIFVKGIKGVKLISQLAAGNSLKELVIDFDGVRMSFRDSCAFLQSRLKDCPKFFGINDCKFDFDIVNKSHEWFVENKEWIPYMIQDTNVLARVCIEFEKALGVIGQSMTTSLGIPGIAYKTLLKTCHGLSNRTYISRDPCTVSFIRESLYGGRILHYKKYFDASISKSRGLICLDMNSLYPSAMALFGFPVGEHKLIEAKSTEEFKKILAEYPLIAEVTLDYKNCRYPLVPYRDDKGNLLYHSGVFRGVYNSVDIREAIIDGAEILEFHRGIFWVKYENIFGDVIKNMFEQRKVLKREKNGLEYVYKILLNSMYGKMLEMIKTRTIFTDEDPQDANLLTNKIKCGQYESRENIPFPISKKPTHIGSFITAYSRKLVNDLIRKVGPENIYYSDTDSIYCTLEAFEKANLECGESLGGYKNDYGEGKYISRAIFLDLKRYYLEFTTGEIKYKFNGINFNDSKCLRNFGYEVGDNAKKRKEVLYEVFKWFLDNPQTVIDRKIINDKWHRLKDEIIIVEQELQFQVNSTDRFIWIDHNAYPYGYDFKRPGVFTLGISDKIIPQDPLRYTLGLERFQSNLIIHTDLSDVQGFDSKAPEKMTICAPSNIETSYIKDASGKVYKMEKMHKEVKIYIADPVWGPVKVFESITEDEYKNKIKDETYKGILFKHSQKGTLFDISSKERDEIFNTLNKRSQNKQEREEKKKTK